MQTLGHLTNTEILTKLLTVDGAGSGLDADLLDGMNTATANTASTIVARDATGGVTASAITGLGTVILGQPAPVVVDVASTLTTGNLLARIIVSNPAVAITLTIPTGTLMDGLYAGALDVGYDWSIVNIGLGAITMAAGVANTIVGAVVVAVGTSAGFRSRRTAANVWVTYRL